MAAKTLAEKMKLKSGMRASVVKVPEDYLEELSAPRDVKLGSTLDAGPYDWLHIFVMSSGELKSLAPLCHPPCHPQGWSG